MMERAGRWLAETRLGRSAFAGSVVLLFATGTWAIAAIEGHRQTDPILQRIEIIERVEPADVIRECLRTPKCRRLFRYPELLQVGGREVQVRARQQDSGREVSQSPSAPEPGVRPGGGEGRAPQRPGRDRPPVPGRPGRDSPSVPQSPAAPQPAPPPQPGNSGSTPGAGQGTKACLDLIVSACVDAPRLLP